jgi:hypothetical protein
MFAVWFARSYFVGIWCVLFYLLMVFFAVISLRKRHILWFVLGFFLPFAWLIGAILPDRRLRREERREERPL